MSAWNDPPGGFHPASAPDYLPRQQLEAVQLQRLRAVVARAYDEGAALPDRAWTSVGSARTSVGALADLARLPFTVKTDLRDTYPFGLFASPMEEVVRLHASSRHHRASPSWSPTPRPTSACGAR